MHGGSFSRKAGVEVAPLAGESMLFDAATGQFFVLNRTMAFLWERCDGKTGLEDTAAALATAYAGVTDATARADVEAAVEELLRLGLLVRSTG